MPHPFKSEKVIKEVEKKSYRELFDEYVDSPLSIEYAIIIDKDVKVSVDKYDEVPTSDFVIIKMVPAGGEDGGPLQTAGGLTKLGGALLVAVGIILGAATLGMSSWITIGLISVGASTMLSGTIMMLTKFPDLAGREQGEQSPQIRGARNQTRIDGMVPVLLGKHRIYPDNASLPYTSINISSGGRLPGWGNPQILHQLFCVGYNDIRVDPSSIKVGDSLYSTIKDPSDPDPLIRYDGVSHTLFPARVVQTDVGVIARYDVDDNNITTENNRIIRTTPTNTYKIELSLSFPNGLVKYDEDNDNEKVNLAVKVLYAYADYDVDGDSFGVGWTRDVLYYQRATADGVRVGISIDLDNSTPSGADYNDKRQYKVGIQRITVESSETDEVSTLYLDNIKSYTAEYVDDIYDNARPIVEDTQAQLCTMSLQITATNNLNGAIDQLSCIAELHTKVYSGVGSGASSWSIVEGTSNPASMFRYVLQDTKVNPYPVSDDRIDWPALEAWYKYCEDKGFECNAVINGDTTIESILSSICSTGRAAWLSIDNLYTIVIDTERNTTVQMFTPRNSWNFNGKKAFAEQPTQLKMQFIDADTDYTQAERIVDYVDGSPDDSTTQSVTLFGVTDAEQAWKHGKYLMAVTRLRPEVFTFQTDIENIVCTLGDLVTITHDAALIGITSGRVKEVYGDAGLTQTEGFLSDEVIPYEAGKTYRVKVRLQDGTISEYPVDTLPSPSNNVWLTTPIVGIDVIQADDLFVFGEATEETLDVIITNIDPSDNLEATITCVPYSPKIYTADSGVILPYNPLISSAGDSGGIINPSPVYDPNANISNITNILAISSANIARAGSALIASRPDAFSLNAMAREVSIIDDGTVVFVGKEDGFLYRTRKTDTFKPEQIGDVVAMNPAGAGLDNTGLGRILYVNKEDEDRIYMKGISAGDDGTPVTTTAGYIPRYLADDEFLYLNSSGFLMRGLVTDVLDGTAVTTFPIYDYTIYDTDNIVYANINDNSTLYLKSSLDDEEGEKVGDTTCSNVHMGISNTVYYINHEDDFNIYRRDISSDDFTEEDPIFNTANSMWADRAGNVVFASLYDSSYIYSGLYDTAIAGGFLEAQPNDFEIEGDVVAGSNRISNVSVEHVDSVVVKDNVYSALIPMGARIKFRGPNYLLMDVDAVGTGTGVAIQVAGTRIVLDANRVIIDGTVTANLLEASAINSKERVDDGSGNFRTEFDLDNGTAIWRKKTGETVLDFNPERTDEELLLQGGFQVLAHGGTINNINMIDGEIQFSDESAIGENVWSKIYGSGGILGSALSFSTRRQDTIKTMRLANDVTGFILYSEDDLRLGNYGTNPIRNINVTDIEVYDDLTVDGTTNINGRLYPHQNPDNVTIDVPASTRVILNRGVYMLSYTTSVQLTIQNGGVWRTGSAGVGGCIFADGNNVGLVNTTPTPSTAIGLRF